MHHVARSEKSANGAMRSRIDELVAMLVITVAVGLSACAGTSAPGTSNAGVSPAVLEGGPQSSTPPNGTLLISDTDKAAVAGLNQWLHMFSSSQSTTVTPCDEISLAGCKTFGASWQVTATIAIDDIAKVGGHRMNGADILTGAASSPTNFIKATVQMRNGNKQKANVPDFTATIEVRRISATIGPPDTLTAADLANGFTYKGAVVITLVNRYAVSPNATPSAYVDDQISVSLTIQNGQAQVVVGGHLSDTWLQGDTGTFSTHAGYIYYPTKAFKQAEDCASVLARGSQCYS
jgi:hypothetical protein